MPGEVAVEVLLEDEEGSATGEEEVEAGEEEALVSTQVEEVLEVGIQTLREQVASAVGEVRFTCILVGLKDQGV